MEVDAAGTRETGPQNHFLPPVRFMVTVVDVNVTVTNEMLTVVKLRMYCKDGVPHLVKLHLYYVTKNADSC